MSIVLFIIGMVAIPMVTGMVCWCIALVFYSTLSVLGLPIPTWLVSTVNVSAFFFGAWLSYVLMVKLVKALLVE